MKNEANRNKLQIWSAMSTRGAEVAGRILANAALVLASAVGAATFVRAVRWWRCKQPYADEPYGMSHATQRLIHKLTHMLPTEPKM